MRAVFRCKMFAGYVKDYIVALKMQESSGVILNSPEVKETSGRLKT